MVTPAGIVVLTDRRLAAGPLVEVVTAAVAGGATWVVLRERDLPYAERRALADSLRDVAPLIVAGPDPLGGSAVHLSAADPLPVDPLGTVGRSCHDAASLARLSDEDYVTLSPVFPTETKPGYGPALTPEGAAGLGSPVPWLALGGVDSAARARRCGAAGAAGVAVMGAVMRAADPEGLVRDLVAAFTEGARSRESAAAMRGGAQSMESAVAMRGGAQSMESAVAMRGGAQSKASGAVPLGGFFGRAIKGELA